MRGSRGAEAAPTGNAKIIAAACAVCCGIMARMQQHMADMQQDMAEMMRQHLTFDEAIASPAFQTMAKSRLNRIRKDVFDQLATCL